MGTSDPPFEETPAADAERPATIEWLELFFDLVVVAAVAVLTEGLREEPTWGGLGLFALLYAGIWFGWVAIVLYANVARAATRMATVIVAMFLVAVMAATAPIHFEHRANSFAIAFVLLRLLASRSARRTGRILEGWPLLEFGGATLPWIVACWFDAPAKYWIWALGLGLDLVFVLLRGGSIAPDQLEQVQRRLDSAGRRGAGRGRGPAPESERVQVSVVGVEREHLEERLGLFVIIVLGEVVSQLVISAATHDWEPSFARIAVVAFVVLVGLWWLTFSYGFVGAPHSRLAQLPPRFGLPMHLLTTMGIVGLAAGIGEMTSESHEHLGTGLRWIACAGLTLYYLVMAVGGVTGGAPRRWLFAWALPCAVVPVAVAWFGAELPSPALLAVLLATIVWMGVYGAVTTRRQRG